MPVSVSTSQFHEWLEIWRTAPETLENCLSGMDETQMNTSYREGGWTVRQLVHHIADSHMNAYIRLRLALTEDNPVIKPYDEKKWAELPDTFAVPVFVSVSLLKAMHVRMVALLQRISEDDWQRTYIHPEQQKKFTIYNMIGLYAWHLRHHIAHIESMKRIYNW